MRSSSAVRLTAPLLTAALASLFAGSASAATHVVSKGGALTSIGAGITAASAGDTVIVKSGTYQENVQVPAGKDGLKLTAKGKVIIEARPAGGAGAGPGIHVLSANVSITGFIIRNAANPGATPPYGTGIECTRDGLTVKKCTITGCQLQAVLVDPGNGTKVVDCDFFANNGGVNINGDNAIVSKVSILNDAADGIIIEGSNAKVSKCTIRTAESEGIDIEGPNAVVEKNKIYDVDGRGIYVHSGSGAKVIKNKIYGAYREGIDLESAPTSLVKGNTVGDTENDGIDVSGSNGTTIKDNSIVATAITAINCSGETCTITGNDARFCGTTGILANGLGHVIEKNTIEHLCGTGIHSDGENPTITKNTLEHCYDDSYGIYVGGSVTMGLISGNKISECAQGGILVDNGTLGLTISDNKITACAEITDKAGLELDGDFHTAKGNTIKDCGADGIRITGDGHTLEKNDVRGSSRDGIDVQYGAGVLVKDNVVKDCGAEGIENNGTNTTVTGNTAKNNRTDFADSGTGATFTGNTSSDGTHANPASPEID